MRESKVLSPSESHSRKARLWRTTPIVFSVCGLIVLVASAQPGWAFDGSRRGFALEFGLGIGRVPVDEFSLSAGPPRLGYRSESCLISRFRVGAGINDLWVVNYVNDIGWTTYGFQKSLWLTGVTGASVTRFLRASARSAFLEAGAGVASTAWLTGSLGSPYRGSGLGIWGGMGYEVGPRLLARVTATHYGLAHRGELLGMALSLDYARF